MKNLPADRENTGGQSRKSSYPLLVLGVGPGGEYPAGDLLSEIGTDGIGAVVFIMEGGRNPASNGEKGLNLIEAIPGRKINPRNFYVSGDSNILIEADGTFALSEVDNTRANLKHLIYRADCNGGIKPVLIYCGWPGCPDVEQLRESGAFLCEIGPDASEHQIAKTGSALKNYRFQALEKDIGSLKLNELLGEIRRHTGNDYSHYRNDILISRIALRMAALELEGYDDYTDMIRTRPPESWELSRRLMLKYSTFKQKVDEFEKLAEKALSLTDRDPLRVWLPACATGEEAYLLAIILKRELDKEGGQREVQILATDLNWQAVEHARNGIYGPEIEDEIPRELLQDYFIPYSGGHRVKYEIRDMIIFSGHNLITAPPFENLDVICCGGFLNCIKKEFSIKLLNDFYSALNPGGLFFAADGCPLRIEEGRFRIFREGRIYEKISRESRQINFEDIISGTAENFTGHGSVKTEYEANALSKELLAINEEIKNRNNEIKQLNNDLVNLLEDMEFAIVILDSRLRIRRYNRKAEELLGEGDFEKNLRDMELSPGFRDQIREVIDKNGVIEKELIGPDGRWYSMKAVSYSSPDHPKGAVVTLSDIDILKRSINYQRKEKRKLDNIIEAVLVPLAVLDENKNIIKVNSAYREYFGKKNVLGILREDIIEKLGEEMNGLNTEMSLDTVSEGERIFLIKSRPIYGENFSIIVTFHDITERERAEELMKRDKETFERLVEERSNQLFKTQVELEKSRRLSDIGSLAAVVAHELRNPLATIRSAAFNIKRKRKNKAIDRNLESIERKINESDIIINNLLNYSKIKMPELKVLNISDLVRECLSEFRKRYPPKKVKVKQKYEASNPRIEGDSFQLQEVFANILNNSAEAMEGRNGLIKVRIFNPEENAVAVSFTDNGCGIDKSDIAKITEPFYSKKSRGTGLGMSVSSQIVQLHRGRIDIESIRGEGTRVTVIMPAALPK